MIGIDQKWVTIHKLSDVSEIHNESSTNGVVRSHSVKLYNKSPIRNSSLSFADFRRSARDSGE